MKGLNLFSILFLSVFLFSFGFLNVKAQDIKHENNICLELKSAAHIVGDNKVLVAGEVLAPAILNVGTSPFTLFQSLAMVGGIKKTSSEKNILIIKCSPEIKLVKSLTFEEYNRTKKKGFGDDPELDGGDVVLVVNRNC